MNEQLTNLTEAEENHLILISKNAHASVESTTAQSLEDKGMVKFGWDSGRTLTDLGQRTLSSILVLKLLKDLNDIDTNKRKFTRKTPQS